MAGLGPWRAVGQHPQLQAAENVLLRTWVCPRPVIPEDTGAPPCHVEMRVYAIHFPGAPGEPVDFVLACVPASAIVNQELGLARVTVDCLGTGGPLDVVDTVDAVLLLLPGSFLSESLLESVPMSSTLLSFSDIVSGSTPSPPDLLASTEIPLELYDGMTAHLELGEDMVLGLRIAALNEGDNEWYVSASEEQVEDARGALTGEPSRPLSTALAKAKPKSAPARKAQARPKLLPAHAGAPPGNVGGLPARPRNMAELSASLGPVLETIAQRLSQLEQTRVQPVSAPNPFVAPASARCEGQVPLPSLLSPVRSTPMPTVPPAMGRAAAGPRAYQESVAEAKRLLEVPGACAPAHTARLSEGVSAGRARQTDTALRMAVEQGGTQASMALQLAMVDALERLGSGATSAAAMEREPRTLEDFLLGVGGSHISEDKAASAFGGAKGLANMQRLARSIEERPAQWSEAFDTSVWRSLSCDVTGAPWSLQRYGQERLHWGNHRDLQRFFWMIAAMHALHRSGQMELLGAKLGQCAKAIEVALLMQGHWAVAWQLTGIADPQPHSALHAGLAHPTELSSSLAYLKEVKLMEEAAKRGGLPTAPDGEPSGSKGPNSGAAKPKQQRGGGKGGSAPPAAANQ
eukprot:4632065-Amphidinium_carterae.1